MIVEGVLKERMIVFDRENGILRLKTSFCLSDVKPITQGPPPDRGDCAAPEFLLKYSDFHKNRSR
jgi:hypothetical protein